MLYVFLDCFSTLFILFNKFIYFETASLTEARGHQLARLMGQPAPWIFLPGLLSAGVATKDISILRKWSWNAQKEFILSVSPDATTSNSVCARDRSHLLSTQQCPFWKFTTDAFPINANSCLAGKIHTSEKKMGAWSYGPVTAQKQVNYLFFIMKEIRIKYQSYQVYFYYWQGCLWKCQVLPNCTNALILASYCNQVPEKGGDVLTTLAEPTSEVLNITVVAGTLVSLGVYVL